MESNIYKITVDITFHYHGTYLSMSELGRLGGRIRIQETDAKKLQKLAINKKITRDATVMIG